MAAASLNLLIMESGTEVYCRLCLKAGTHYSPLFEDNIVDMLESLTSIKISYNDSAPNVTCFRCLVEMKCAYKTQQRLIKSERFLQEKMSSETVVKEEIAESDCKKEEIEETAIKCEEGESATEQQIEKTDHMYHKVQELFMCSICQNEYSSVLDYREHIQIHEMEHSLTFPNVISSDMLKEDLQADIHNRKDFNNVSITKPAFYTCRTCLDIYNSIPEYRKHVKTHETRKCDMCPKVIPRNELTAHCQTHKNGFCEYCGAQLKNSRGLRRHVNLQHNEVKFMCEQCGDIIDNREAFDLHLSRRHSDPTFMCDQCGAKYFRLAHLNKHIKVKHLKLDMFSCKICGKSFGEQFQLKVHALKHSNKMLFICEFCGKGFKFQGNMNSHKKNAHGWKCDQKFKCKWCSKGFPTKISLCNHVARKHQ